METQTGQTTTDTPTTGNPDALPDQTATPVAPVTETPTGTAASTEAVVIKTETPELPGVSVSAEPPIAETTGDGCQCPKCKAEVAAGGKAERRGRHHKACPCVKCQARSGEPQKQQATQEQSQAQPLKTAQDLLTNSTPPASVDYEALAGITFDTAVGGAAMVFGENWLPESPEERLFVVKPLATYLQTKQVKDIPPGVAVCFVCAVYASKRKRAVTVWDKCKVGWVWIKARFRK